MIPSSESEKALPTKARGLSPKVTRSTSSRRQTQAALALTLPLLLSFVFPKANLPLTLAVAFVLTLLSKISAFSLKDSPCPPFLAILLLAFGALPHPALAATKKKPSKPKATQSTHHAPPHASAKKPAHTKPSHTKPTHAKPHGKSTTRTPTRPSPRYEAPDSAIAATPAPRTQLAEAPTSPFYNLPALAPFFRALSAHQALPPDSPNAASSVPALAATVRVLQFGDSHTAADLFTGDLRAQLQSRFGNGGLGFQYPGHPFPGYHLAGSNRSQTSGWFTEGNKFTQLGDGDLGLGGISIATSRPGESVSLTTTCTTLQVQYLRQPQGGHLRFTDNGTFISDIDTATSPGGGGSSYSEVPSPDTPSQNQGSATSSLPRAAANDSRPSTTSAGTLTYACTPGDHTFELTTLDRSPVRLLGLVTESPGITYECLGINGAVAPLMLRWNQALFAEYLRQRDPDLIVLAYGTNEAAQSPGSNQDYIAQFHRLLQNLHRIVPAAAILVLGPYDRALRAGRGRRAAWHTFAGTDRIIADQKQACHLYNCAFYDERTRMGGPGAMIRWVSAGLAQGDRTHLTGPGYRALAEALYRDLMSAYATYQQTTTATLTPYPHPNSHHPSNEATQSPTANHLLLR